MFRNNVWQVSLRLYEEEHTIAMTEKMFGTKMGSSQHFCEARRSKNLLDKTIMENALRTEIGCLSKNSTFVEILIESQPNVVETISNLRRIARQVVRKIKMDPDQKSGGQSL